MSQQATSQIERQGEQGKGNARRVLTLAAVKIRQHRDDNNLTAADLAAQLGVTQPAVIYWETGQKKPRNAMQGKLKALGICSADDWHEPAPPANDAGATDGGA